MQFSAVEPQEAATDLIKGETLKEMRLFGGPRRHAICVSVRDLGSRTARLKFTALHCV